MSAPMKCLIAVALCVILVSPLQAQRGIHQTDRYGAIVRGDTTRKAIALVLTGHEFADGGSSVRKTLRAKKVPASFFFTGAFYANPVFSKLIRQLKKDGHYLGAHSNRHLFYADWDNRDSTLVTADEFRQDLIDNYTIMAEYGITHADANYFLPPYEWYNKTIADWTKEMNLTLINFSSGTRSHADYTYPAMGSRYVGSDEIYQSILNYEMLNGMNGFILLIHIGTDPRRTDKLYHQLDKLIDELRAKGYAFKRVDDLLR